MNLAAAQQRARDGGAGETLVRQLLPRLESGSLEITLPSGRSITVLGLAPGPAATLRLLRLRTLRRLLLNGDIGFGEAYMDGDWSSPDLPALLAVFAKNQETLRFAPRNPVARRAVDRLLHWIHNNTLRGSRRNIIRHYDLGNEFYSLWLDSGMSYSSALFTAPGLTLDDAQSAKQDRVLDMLGLRGGDKVLEIGFGWGGLAERMAAAGARVTGLTLSPAQHGYAERRLLDAGRSDQVDLQQCDYRNVRGSFDHIVSIEMIEAVGEKYWPLYFDALKTRLRRGGTIVLQAITIDDARFENYRRSVDFIQRYIFAGGMLPSPSVLQHEIARVGLKVCEVQKFGASYATTLMHWRQRFLTAWPLIAQQGFSDRFKRMWEYYLAYSEAGFRAGVVDVGLWRLEHK
jgi:cyclopropane-fatty-acyl-phospholipid synthase